jgi:hypothetical protein
VDLRETPDLLELPERKVSLERQVSKDKPVPMEVKACKAKPAREAKLEKPG